MLISGFQSWSEAELRPLTDVQAAPGQHWRVEQGHDPGFPPSEQDRLVQQGRMLIAREHPEVIQYVLRKDGFGGASSPAISGAR